MADLIHTFSSVHGPKWRDVQSGDITWSGAPVNFSGEPEPVRLVHKVKDTKKHISWVVVPASDAEVQQWIANGYKRSAS